MPPVRPPVRRDSELAAFTQWAQGRDKEFRRAGSSATKAIFSFCEARRRNPKLTARSVIGKFADGLAVSPDGGMAGAAVGGSEVERLQAWLMAKNDQLQGAGIDPTVFGDAIAQALEASGAKLEDIGIFPDGFPADGGTVAYRRYAMTRRR